jgi:hypothetical protein
LSEIGIDFYLVTFFLLGIFFLAILGYAVETTSFGDKINMKNSLVEAIDEDNPEQVLIETKKKTWALILYSFSP